MKIRLLTVSHKAPAWLQEGYLEYAKRLPTSYALELVEIAAEKRTANSDIPRIIEREGEKLLARTLPTHLVIALDVKGKQWSTEDLAKNLETWQQDGRNIDLLVGGADGLSTGCIKRATHLWSLSALTFPHLFVRLILAEQIYRAFTILQQHPYHRK
jgi:23S rRNA (pseudouridine1915-N3)-methyltransferase